MYALFYQKTQNRWANFNRTWHKALFAKRNLNICKKDRAFLKGDKISTWCEHMDNFWRFCAAEPLEFKIKPYKNKIIFWQIGLFKFYKKGNISQCADYNHIFILGSKDNIAQACILLKMLHAYSVYVSDERCDP